MGLITRVNKPNGETDWEIGDNFKAEDINGDLNMIYDEFNGSIDDDNIDTIGGGKITDNSIGEGKILDGSVTSDKLADRAADSLRIAQADGETGQNTETGAGVKEGHIQDDAISSAKIHEAVVGTGQNTNAGYGVKTDHIQNLAVTTAKIASQAVTPDRLKKTYLMEDGEVWTDSGGFKDFTFTIEPENPQYPDVIPLPPFVEIGSLVGNSKLRIEQYDLEDNNPAVGRIHYGRIRVTAFNMGPGDSISVAVKWPAFVTS